MFNELLGGSNELLGGSNEQWHNNNDILLALNQFTRAKEWP